LTSRSEDKEEEGREVVGKFHEDESGEPGAREAQAEEEQLLLCYKSFTLCRTYSRFKLTVYDINARKCMQ
jgi:hypothetical protein